MRRGRPTLASKDATPGAKATTPPVVDLTKPGKNARNVQMDQWETGTQAKKFTKKHAI